MYIAGYQAKLTINGLRYAFGHATWNSKVDKLRTTNSEGLGAGLPGGGRLIATAGAHTLIPGNGELDLTITQVAFDTTQNPFALPYNYFSGAIVAVSFFPNLVGVGVATPSLVVPQLMIVEIGQDNDVVGMGPIKIVGVSNGWWSNPYT